MDHYHKKYEVIGLNGDPCVCGARDTWHGECYRGLTQQQIDDKLKKVWNKIKIDYKKKVAALSRTVIKDAQEKK